MRSVAIVKWVFTLVGLGMLVGAALLYLNTRSFLARASVAPGVVIDLVASRSSDSITYRPVVRFSTAVGERVEFASGTSSNPPSYAKGEAVEVLYSPNQPRDAKINGVFSLWGGSLILGGMGGVFLLIGVGIFVVPMLGARGDERLIRTGMSVETKFQSVELNTRFEMNGRHPFRVVTQWQNPATSEIHVFESHNLWFDPTEYVKDRKIRVFVDRGNAKRYHVDLSFLPKLAR